MRIQWIDDCDWHCLNQPFWPTNQYNMHLVNFRNTWPFETQQTYKQKLWKIVMNVEFYVLIIRQIFVESVHKLLGLVNKQWIPMMVIDDYFLI